MVHIHAGFVLQQYLVGHDSGEVRDVDVVFKSSEHPLDVILIEVGVVRILHAFLQAVDEEDFSFSRFRLVGVSYEHHGFHR